MIDAAIETAFIDPSTVIGYSEHGSLVEEIICFPLIYNFLTRNLPIGVRIFVLLTVYYMTLSILTFAFSMPILNDL